MSLFSQEALDEGLQLQQAVNDVTAEENFLLRLLGSEVTAILLKTASDALTESQTALETLSRCVVRHRIVQRQADNGVLFVTRFKMLLGRFLNFTDRSQSRGFPKQKG